MAGVELQYINLLSEELRPKPIVCSARFMLKAWAVLLLTSLLLSGLGLLGLMALESSLTQSKQHVQQAQHDLQRLTQELASFDAKQHAPKNELNDLEARYAVQQQMLHGMQNGSMGNRDGYSAHMKAFARQALDGLWLTDIAIWGNDRLQLQGETTVARLVPAYIQRLGKETVLRDVRFTLLDMQEVQDASHRKRLEQLSFVLSTYREDLTGAQP